MKRFPLLTLILILGGCSTLVRPFTGLRPDYQAMNVQAMHEVAAEIEQAVQEGNRTPHITSRDGIVITPALRQVIRTRAARSAVVNKYRSTGFGVEEPNGLLQMSGGRAYSRATTKLQRNRDAATVMDENQSRWALYEGIERSSKLSRRNLSAIQRIFYEERIKVMPNGQKYKDLNGHIVVKGGAAAAAK